MFVIFSGGFFSKYNFLILILILILNKFVKLGGTTFGLVTTYVKMAILLENEAMKLKDFQ